MPKKPLDPRIPELISDSVKTNTRSIFVIVGSPKQQNAQITNLHYLLTQTRMHQSMSKADRPNVLWCYKKELGFISNRVKRESKIKREIKRGARDQGDLDPFELFVGVTDIRYCYYKETSSILGQTYGMLVLQDFEALTPNLLARTIETVQGGGIVVLLLSGLTSLKRLYTVSMDVHARYRTESSGDPVARFNERFILSLGSCPSCLVVDDELNILPISSQSTKAPSATSYPQIEDAAKASKELKNLKASLTDVQPVGSIVDATQTLDQAHALLAFADAIVAKTLSNTVTLTAARGRGKSACLGLAISLAVAHGYSNIFVTSPSPENLTTLFDFFFKGLKILGYTEHIDWDVTRSAHEEWRGAVVRVNIFRDHRQTVQYIQPQDSFVLGQAELVIIDEAAAIPLPLVKKLLGPYLVFLSSTINGYEGTGRSLSLKLIQQLRESSRSSGISDNKNTISSSQKEKSGSHLLRSLKELKLAEPIRYNTGDNIESWLNSLLCLDVSTSRSTNILASGKGNAPHPSACELYHVSRDTLFSFHPASELFLQRVMSLYVASHYKNSPNDLQLLSDAPNHALFVLLPPIPNDQDSGAEEKLPEPLVVVQVALEGRISKNSILNSLERGQRAGGDLIPWTLSQQFQDNEFASLSGARIVRIAVHPDFTKMGYGSRALDLLAKFYSGEFINLKEVDSNKPSNIKRKKDESNSENSLHTEVIKVRDVSTMEPLLQQLSDVNVERLDYIGTSYGLTGTLFKFWKRAGYVPLYLRQTKNDLTGEHTCIMVRTLMNKQSQENGNTEDSSSWLRAFTSDFRKRFIALLSYSTFNDLTAGTALSILNSTKAGLETNDSNEITAEDAKKLMSPFDYKRLRSYTNNVIDYHAIMDLMPTLAILYFDARLSSEVKISTVQSSILMSFGAQRKTVEEIEAELDLPVSQILALLTKTIRKLLNALEEIQSKEIGSKIPIQEQHPSIEKPKLTHQSTADIEQELEDEGNKAMREQQKELINSLNLDKYAIPDDDDNEDWQISEAVNEGDGSIAGKRSSVVSIKRSAPQQSQDNKGTPKKTENGKRKSSHGSKGSHEKKRRHAS